LRKEVHYFVTRLSSHVADGSSTKKEYFAMIKLVTSNKGHTD